MNRLTSLIKYAALGLFVAAIVKELRKPPEEREWHGNIAGLVPYDFRMPTPERVLDTYWNPDEPRIFTERVLGVGWGINFGRLYKMSRECCSSRSEQPGE